MPARPTGSLLVLKALATLEGLGLFDCLDPSKDAQQLRSLRLTCAELRQLVDCFGTKTLHIKLLEKDYPHNDYWRTCTRLDYAQLRQTGAALGRYHARLTGPVLPRTLCINAKTARPRSVSVELCGGGDGGDMMAVYLAGYMSVAGVPAMLAQVTECRLAGHGDSEYGPVHSGVWYALVPHLTSLTHLTLRFERGMVETTDDVFEANHAPLSKACLLAMLPPSALLRTLAIEQGAYEEGPGRDQEGCSSFLRRAAGVLKGHPIHELRLTSHDALPDAQLLRALGDALPSLERLRVTQLKPDAAIWPKCTSPVSFPAEREQSTSAAGGGLGQLTFGLGLFDDEPAWGAMQLQALPITDGGGGGGGGGAAAAGGPRGSSSAGLGGSSRASVGSSSAGPSCFDPPSDAERACWEQLVRQLSARAPQLFRLEWESQDCDGAASILPAAWSDREVARAARYLMERTAVAGASGSEGEEDGGGEEDA